MIFDGAPWVEASCPSHHVNQVESQLSYLAYMERHRCELLLSLFAVRPVAVDLLISPRDGTVQFALRVLQLPQTPSNSQLSLHRAVFDDRTHILATLLANSPHANPNETDVHGTVLESIISNYLQPRVNLCLR
jgi:hypothetical protein